jgi:hypothetical protein
LGDYFNRSDVARMNGDVLFNECRPFIGYNFIDWAFPMSINLSGDLRGSINV